MDKCLFTLPMIGTGTEAKVHHTSFEAFDMIHERSNLHGRILYRSRTQKIAHLWKVDMLRSSAKHAIRTSQDEACCTR